MSYSPQLRFTDKEYRTLCFMHAAQAAVVEHKEIEVEVDEFGGEGDMRSTHCVVCYGQEEL